MAEGGGEEAVTVLGGVVGEFKGEDFGEGGGEVGEGDELRGA